MSEFLLDVNVLVALFWPAHASHVNVQEWFSHNSRRGWATCPLTEAGFVRVVSNPAFSRDAVSPAEAARVLEASVKHRYHRFWPDSIEYPEAVRHIGATMTGHRQVTDAYLLGLAIRNNGRLATLDQGLLSLATAAFSRSVEIIGT